MVHGRGMTSSVLSCLQVVYLLVMTRAYEEIVDFIAAGTTPDAVVSFRPSDEARERVEELLTRQRKGTLTPDEAADLSHYLELEHIMRLAKARARQHRP